MTLPVAVPAGMEIVSSPSGGAGADTTPALFQLDEATVQKVLRAARRAGLLREKKRDYGQSGITDQGTTAVEVHAATVDRAVSVYALLVPAGDRGLTPSQQRAPIRVGAEISGSAPVVSVALKL